MEKIKYTEFPFAKYKGKIEEAKFYRSKSHCLTVYTGFESDDHDGIFILKNRDQLEIFKSDSPSPLDMVYNLEGKHSLESFDKITWNELSKEEQGRFMGA